MGCSVEKPLNFENCTFSFYELYNGSHSVYTHYSKWIYFQHDVMSIDVMNQKRLTYTQQKAYVHTAGIGLRSYLFTY